MSPRFPWRASTNCWAANRGRCNEHARCSKRESVDRITCRDLRLPAVRRCFEEKARHAEGETLSYERYLFELIDLECQERRQHRTERLLQESKLPLEKTLENFDLKRLPQKAARQVKTLQDGTFLDRKENVLAFGNPGSGKTHLSVRLWRKN